MSPSDQPKMHADNCVVPVQDVVLRVTQYLWTNEQVTLLCVSRDTRTSFRLYCSRHTLRPLQRMPLNQILCALREQPPFGRSQVTLLNLHCRALSDADVKAFKAVVPRSSLTTLGLRNVHMSNKRCLHLCSALLGSSVTSVNVSFNYITNVSPLAAVLPHTRFRKVNISHNNIGDAGLCALAKVLPQSLLQELEVQNSDIGCRGATALASVLSTSRLTRCNMSMNHIGDVGALDVAHGVSQGSLTDLGLSFNLVGDVGAQALVDTLIYGRLQHLDITFNVVTKAKKRAIKTLVCAKSSVMV